MDQRLKRIRELFRYAVTLTRDEGVFTMLRRGAGFFRRRFLGKRARYLPAKKYWRPSVPNLRGTPRWTAVCRSSAS